MSSELARYTTDSGKEIVLTPDYIRKYISTDENVSMEDMHFFAMMCENYKMNPVLDADLIKYGNNVTIQPKASYWMRIASAHPQFYGIECGITSADGRGSTARTGTTQHTTRSPSRSTWAARGTAPRRRRGRRCPPR